MAKTISATARSNYRAAARKMFREGRRRFGMTQAQLGRALQLSQGEVSRVEAGKVEPPVWFIMYLLHLFPDMLQAIDTDLEELRRSLRKQVDSMDAAAIGALLALTRR